LEVDAEYLVRVVARMRPYIREGKLLKSRLERVLASLEAAPTYLEIAVIGRLQQADVVIVDDSPRPSPRDAAPPAMRPRFPAAPSTQPPVASTAAPQSVPARPAATVPGASSAVAAARRRLELDLHTRQPGKVILTAQEEVGLATLLRGESGKPLAQGGFGKLEGEARRAAECLLLHNQGLVHAVAQKYAPPGMSYEDVFQHGVVGVMRAVELFDPSMGNKFSTYAMNWVQQAITRGIANESRLIRLPVHMFERVSKVWAARARLTVDGEAPNVHSLALACELTDEQVIECLALGPQDLLSLDQPVGDGGTTLGDLLDVEVDGASAEELVEFQLLQEQLTAVLDTLSEREAGVISMRFGLTDGEPKTLEEIGTVYGVTRERIRQIESKTMGKLKHKSRSAVLRPFL
jgi:RNA polymerase primary sigma factor